MAARNVTGHVFLAKRKRGPKWYAKYRLPDGRQVQKILGPAWTEKGRPPAGYYTERTAKEALAAILADARRGTLAGMHKTGATFPDAAAEFLRFKGEVRKIDPATWDDYRGVIDRYLLPEFGDKALEAVTPDMIDAYKERLIAEGDCPTG
jgi:integrase